MILPSAKKALTVPKEEFNILVNTSSLGEAYAAMCREDVLRVIFEANINVAVGPATTWLDLLVPKVFHSRNECKRQGFRVIPWGFHRMNLAGMQFTTYKPRPHGAIYDD